MAKKTRQPTDSTMRNTKAANKRLDALELKSHELANGLTSMEAAIIHVKERLSLLEQPVSGVGVGELPADGDTD